MRAILTALVATAAACLVLATGARDNSTSTRPPQPPSVLIIPRPKSMEIRDWSMAITASTKICACDRHPDRVALDSIQRELARYGVSPLSETTSVKAGAAGIIYVGVPVNSAKLRQLLKSAHLAASTHPEGYVIDVEPSYAVVAGHDAAGAFYGVQTLCQLICPGSRGTVEIAGARIDDYPTLRRRGALLFCGIDALPFHKRLIANVFARFKMNELVLECEQARWNALGRAAPAWAMPKPLLKQDIAFARSHHMRVVPLVNSVGHMEWLLRYPANVQLAEDPRTPYAAAVDNPATDRVLFRLYNEVLQTFHSNELHVGGDEVTMRGEYPCTSRRRYPTASDAFVAQIDKLHAFLACKHIKTMMWADMLLARGDDPETLNSLPAPDAAKIRAALPKGIELVDWHYAAEPAYPSATLLRASGFSHVIGATWNDPANIASFAHTIASSHEDGLLQTTWAGYESSERNLEHERSQFTAFIVAAEEAWNGGTIPADKLGYDPGAIFDRVYHLTPYD